MLTGPADSCEEQTWPNHSSSLLAPSASCLLYTRAQIKVFSDEFISSTAEQPGSCLKRDSIRQGFTLESISLWFSPITKPKFVSLYFHLWLPDNLCSSWALLIHSQAQNNRDCFKTPSKQAALYLSAIQALSYQTDQMSIVLHDLLLLRKKVGTGESWSLNALKDYACHDKMQDSWNWQ